MSLSDAVPGLGKASNSWVTVFAPWNVLPDAVSAYQAPKVAKAQGEVALMEQEAARAEAARQQQEAADLADALAQLQGSKATILQRWRRGSDAAAEVQQVYAAASSARLPLDPTPAAQTAQGKRDSDDLVATLSGVGSPETAEVALAAKSRVDAIWQPLADAVAKIEAAAREAKADLARASAEREQQVRELTALAAAQEEEQQRRDSAARLAAFAGKGPPGRGQGTPSDAFATLQPVPAAPPARRGLFAFLFGGSGLAGVVPGQAWKYPQSGLGGSRQPSNEDKVRLTKTARDLFALSQQANEGNAAWLRAKLEETRDEIESFLPWDEPAPWGLFGTWDTSGEIKTILGQVLVNVKRAEGSTGGDWRPQNEIFQNKNVWDETPKEIPGAIRDQVASVFSCAALPGPLPWICENPGKTAGIAVGVLGVLYLGPTLLGRARAFGKAARS